MNRHGYVYWLSDGEHVKIGFSSYPAQRIRELQTGNGRPLSLVALEAAAPAREGELHRFFSEKRRAGEWFLFDSEMRAAASVIGITAAEEVCDPAASPVTGIVETLRSLISADAPHGFNSDIAARMGWRKERVSRELSGVEKLSVELLLAAIEAHARAGRRDMADRIIRSLLVGQTVRL